jgi:hypothetical protein
MPPHDFKIANSEAYSRRPIAYCKSLLYPYLIENRPVLHYSMGAKKGRETMNKPEVPHAMHDEHLCYLVNMGYIESSFNDYKKLVKDAKFVCKKCGRSADSDENLCQPHKI